MRSIPPRAIASTRSPDESTRMSQEVLPGFTRSRRAREGGLALLLLLPSLVIFGVFVFYPLVHNVYLGFFRSPPFPGLPSTYVGFDQYKDVLTSSDFLDSLKTTVLFALYTVPIGIALGIGLAVLAHQQLKGIGIYRTFFSSTVATSTRRTCGRCRCP